MSTSVFLPLAPLSGSTLKGEAGKEIHFTSPDARTGKAPDVSRNSAHGASQNGSPPLDDAMPLTESCKKANRKWDEAHRDRKYYFNPLRWNLLHNNH